MTRDGRAKVKGTIVLKAGFIKEHSFELGWEHVVRSLRENGTVRAEITQQVTTVGRVMEDSSP